MPRLSGRVAIVTGGAKGIGRDYCKALAAEGASVVIADIADGGALAQEIAATGGSNAVMAESFDVSDEKQVGDLVARVIERFGRIDILVNNAALFAPLTHQAIVDIDVATWDRVFAVNVRGPFLMAKYVAPHMIARRYGKIVNIGSGVAYKGMPRMTHYASSKGAIATLTRSLSRELGEHNICVNTLAPGLIMSDTLVAAANHSEQLRTTVVNSRAFRRDAYPADLTGALIFLASAESDFITGQTIAIDGGTVNT